MPWDIPRDGSLAPGNGFRVRIQASICDCLQLFRGGYRGVQLARGGYKGVQLLRGSYRGVQVGLSQLFFVDSCRK